MSDAVQFIRSENGLLLNDGASVSNFVLFHDRLAVEEDR
jgi:hypothetical protein